MDKQKKKRYVHDIYYLCEFVVKARLAIMKKLFYEGHHHTNERVATEGILITCVVIIRLSYRMRRLNYDRTKHYPHSLTIISITLLNTSRDLFNENLQIIYS